MSYVDQHISVFTDALADKAPVPGGGGASALVGAIGSALSSMVASITVSRIDDPELQQEIEDLLVECEKTRSDLLALVDADAKAFEPLSRAYRIPKDNPDRAEILEKALHDACVTPIQIMRACCEAIGVHERMSQLGAGTVISDVGVGVACAKTALEGASLNVFINTKLMKDRACAERFEAEAQEMLDEYCAKADAVYRATVKRIRG
ncbi:MAG: cyclodeaminase/cyclohydrolase family protein [Coriobacteriales bacterium]|jgi:formiminotetrahydrofolate cyclodeaminase